MRKARLTIRRLKILQLISLKFDNKMIAKEMNLSMSNTKLQKWRLYCYLGVHNSKDAVEVAKLMGLI